MYIYFLIVFYSKLSNGTIYSLHKFETFDHIKKFYKKFKAKDVEGFKIEYDLPKSYKFHKKGK